MELNRGPLAGSSRIRISGPWSRAVASPRRWAHAEREPAHPAVGRTVQTHLSEHAVDPGLAGRSGECVNAEVAASSAPGVEAGCFQYGPDLVQRIGELDIWSAIDGGIALARCYEAEEHAQRGGLAGPVRAEEPDNGAGGHVEAEVINGDQRSEALGERPDLDHRHRRVSSRLGQEGSGMKFRQGSGVMASYFRAGQAAAQRVRQLRGSEIPPRERGDADAKAGQAEPA